MKFMVGRKLVAITEARGPAEDPTICFRVLGNIVEIGDGVQVACFGKGGFVTRISGAEFRKYADWAFCGGCPRFCPNPSLVA